MIRILYVLNGPMEKGGTEAVILNWLKYLNTEEFSVDFLIHGFEEVEKENTIHKELISMGHKFFYVTPRGNNYFKNKNDLINFFKQNNYDVIHSHMDAVGYFLFKIVKKYSPCKPYCISHAHTSNAIIKKDEYVKSQIYSLVHKFARYNLPKYTDLNLACSLMAGNWLFGRNKFLILNNGIELDKFAFKKGTRDRVRNEFGLNGKVVLGHVGRFSVEKNHSFLIDIFEKYLSVEENSVLLLIGEGELQESMFELVKSRGLEKYVLFLGRRNNVNDYLQAMDVFLLPSIHEGLPLVAVEAQASGLPTLISDQVTSEVCLLDTTKLIAINKGKDIWIDNLKMAVAYKKDRNNTVSILKSKKFDISEIVMDLEGIYREGYKVTKKNRRSVY